MKTASVKASTLSGGDSINLASSSGGKQNPSSMHNLESKDSVSAAVSIVKFCGYQIISENAELVIRLQISSIIREC
jgi:hypothetical protein